MQKLVFQTLGVIVVMLFAANVLSPGSVSSLTGDSMPFTSSGPAEGSSVELDGSADGETVIDRDESGRFRLQAQINGEDTEFLVDSGADVVALTVEDAERAGIDFDPADFKPITRTASGSGMGASVTIDRIEFGGATFNNVRGVVLEGLEVNLLGQSVLRKLGKIEQSGDRMIIRHD